MLLSLRPRWPTAGLGQALRSLSRPITQLVEVGRLEPVKDAGHYDTGQLFMHKYFGYRGIVLFPWQSSLVTNGKPRSDNPMFAAHITVDGKRLSRQKSSRAGQANSQYYYQVMIDSRDSMADSVTFLTNSRTTHDLTVLPGKKIHAVKMGLDYAFHEDILPYVSSDSNPIQNDYFHQFLQLESDDQQPQTTEDGMLTWVANEKLKEWQEKHYPWLELSEVHRETTEGIRVSVIPFYMGFKENKEDNAYWWRYFIRVENLTDKSVKLRERNWRIFSLSGTLDTQRCPGVFDQGPVVEPVLSKEQPVFQYSSHVLLMAPSGHMWGTFRMEREDGYSFECRIPPFTLESRGDASNNNNNIETT